MVHDPASEDGISRMLLHFTVIKGYRFWQEKAIEKTRNCVTYNFQMSHCTFIYMFLEPKLVLHINIFYMYFYMY